MAIFENVLPQLEENRSNASLGLIENNKIKLVELLWLFANITQSKDERLKYEFVNLGLHEKIETAIEEYPSIG